MVHWFSTLTSSYFIALILFVLAISIIVEAEEYEGNSCVMKDNTPGVCKSIRACQWFMNGLKAKTLTFTDIKRCSFKDMEEIICCGDEQPTVDVTTRRSRAPGDIVFAGDVMTLSIEDRTDVERTSKLACEKYMKLANYQNTGLDFHILSGTKSLLGEFPHMVAIGYKSEEVGKNISWGCGGSLISERYVLTAAHCVSNRKQPPFIVRMGKVTLDSFDDDAIAQDFTVAEIKIHPEYSSREKYNDIALIKLNAKPIMDDKVRPACITFDESTLSESAPVIVTGFGITNFTTREKSDVLLQTNLQLVETSKCNQTLSDNNKFTTRQLNKGLNGRQMCAHDPTMISDTCQGDSGGPLQVKVGNISYVLGITSFGEGCGSIIPSIYARISYYLTWIEDIVWANGVNNE